MSDVLLTSRRLTLEWFSPAIAIAIQNEQRMDDWAREFPTRGELRAAQRVVSDRGNGQEHAPFLNYVVRENETGLLIGGAGFHGRPKDRTIELGYGFVPEFWGRGLATEATEVLLAAAFASGEIDQVVASTDLDNVRSKAVLKRAGFSPTNETETYWVASDPLVNDLFT